MSLSKAFLSFHTACGTDLTPRGLKKRFDAEKKKDPSMTLECFGVQPEKWKRRREAVLATFLTIDGERLSVSAVIRRLGKINEGGTAFVNSLRKFVMAYPERREFASLEILQSNLKRGTSGHGGNVANNPIIVDGTQYPNAARLRDILAATGKISQRTFSSRILSLKKQLKIAGGEPLILSEDELIGLYKWDDRLDKKAFCDRVANYCKVNGVKLVSENGEPTSVETEYDVQYINNQTLFYFICLKCEAAAVARATSGADAKGKHVAYAKSIAKLSQGCPDCAQASRAIVRRLAEKHIINVINTHPLGLVYRYGGEGGVYKNQNSIITATVLNCEHTLRRSYASFRDEKLLVCPTCNPNIGETLTLAVAGHLLGANASEIQAAREVTPAWLRAGVTRCKGHLRYDGFFASHRLPSGRVLIVEHHGVQHYGKNIRGRNLTEEEKRAATENDKIKQNAAEARARDVAFAVVPDVVFYCQDLLQAAAYIADHLLNAVPELRAVPSFKKKLRQLNDFSFLMKLASEIGLVDRPEARLRAQLDRSGKNHIAINYYDPIARKFKLTCLHQGHEPYTWSPLANNVLEGSSTENCPSGCPKCGVIARVSMRRLTESELDARAASHGLVRSFDYAEYENTRKVYPWVCVKFGHKRNMSVEKMNGCRECRSLESSN